MFERIVSFKNSFYSFNWGHNKCSICIVEWTFSQYHSIAKIYYDFLNTPCVLPINCGWSSTKSFFLQAIFIVAVSLECTWHLQCLKLMWIVHSNHPISQKKKTIEANSATLRNSSDPNSSHSKQIERKTKRVISSIYQCKGIIFTVIYYVHSKRRHSFHRIFETLTYASRCDTVPHSKGAVVLKKLRSYLFTSGV